MKRLPVVGFVIGFLSRLRFPVLFVVTAIAFVIDLAVPDLIPFGDEVALGLLAALLAAWRKRRTEGMETGEGPAASDDPEKGGG